MARKKSPVVEIHLQQKKIKLLLDKLLFFRFLQNLHGRFWGIATVFGLLFGLYICYLIRPDMLNASIAVSYFGDDVRTAPYFAGTMFFAAYGLWRWRNYLGRTMKRNQPVLTLMTLTIIGLYLVALMPIGWKSWPYKVHLFGVFLAGTTMAATVIIDSILSKTERGKNETIWKLIKFVSFTLIVTGGITTYASLEQVGLLNIALIGELMMIAGYSIWIGIKTYRGEGKKSRISRLLGKIIVID